MAIADGIAKLKPSSEAPAAMVKFSSAAESRAEIRCPIWTSARAICPARQLDRLRLAHIRRRQNLVIRRRLADIDHPVHASERPRRAPPA